MTILNPERLQNATRRYKLFIRDAAACSLAIGSVVVSIAFVFLLVSSPCIFSLWVAHVMGWL